MNLQVFLGILAFLVPLTHALGFICAAHAIFYTRSSQGAIAWALSLIFFPYLAIPLYLILGRRRFYGYVEARRAGDSAIDHLANRLITANEAHAIKFTGDQQRFDVFNHLADFPFTGGNSARLLIDGEQTFNAIFDAIASAKLFLLIQFFIIRDDELGRRLRDALIEKAGDGVHVYVLFDEIGSLALPPNFSRMLREAGAKVHPFNSRRGWRNRFQINFRNHRKIVAVDGRIAFVGGHNVGVEYLGQSRFGHWRDTHIAITGPAVAGVQWSFVEDWHWSTGELLTLPAPPEIAGLNAGDGCVKDAAACVISTGPADDTPTCTLMFLAAINAARHRLWIASPYFVPDEAVYDSLQLAAIRGVDVRIMLPAKADHVLVYLAGFSYLKSAERAGVKFYRYATGFLHQKVMLVDDDLAAVGTANLDNRSMYLNFEQTVLLADKAFAAKVAAMLETDFEACERATPGDLGRRALPFRIAVRIARLTSPLQ